MTGGWSRRDVLTVGAAAMALPVGALALRAVAGAPTPVSWHGESLGGLASLTVWHRHPEFARQTLARMRHEIDRLERVFSLYRADSEIARLNDAGRLHLPSRDLVAVLEESRRIAAASLGAFDPTVQPLWDIHWRHRGAFMSPGTPPDQAALDAARARVDFTAIDTSTRAIGFARPRMAITLNGIAQGYITDRITDLLRNEGYEHAMVELGETRALGAAPDGKPFRVHVARPDAPSWAGRVIELADEALSVSGGYGHPLGPNGTHHIFDPKTGRGARRLLDVVVIAPRATIADGLSTAMFVAGESASRAILTAYPLAQAWITRPDGTTAKL